MYSLQNSLTNNNLKYFPKLKKDITYTIIWKAILKLLNQEIWQGTLGNSNEI